MIFGFSTSFGSRDKFSFGGSGAAAASSFFALAGFFAGLAGASGAAAAGASADVAPAASGAAVASTLGSSASVFGFGAFAGFFSSESAMTKFSNPLNFAGFRVLVPDHADCLAGAFAGARVGGGALATNRQTTAMANPAITIDRLETLQIALRFPAEVAFDRDLI